MKGEKKYPELLKWLRGGPEGWELTHIGVGAMLINLMHPFQNDQHRIGALIKCLEEDFHDIDFFFHLKKLSLSRLTDHFKLNLALFENLIYVMNVTEITQSRPWKNGLFLYTRMSMPIIHELTGARVLLQEKPLDIPSSGLNVGDKIELWEPPMGAKIANPADPFHDNLARTIQAEINLYAQTHEIEEL